MIQELFTPANFEFFARYFLAGFILFSVRNRYVLGERAKAGEIVVEAVILSLINQLVFLTLGYLKSSVLGVLPETIAVWPAFTDATVSFYIEILILPACLGVLFGANLHRGWNRAFLRRISMPVVHPTRRAYDFAFADREPCFLLVNFKDGGSVYGFFGQDSLAASDPARSDIFLERLYDVGNEGQWTESKPSRSALIAIDDIRSIEFVPIPTEEGNEPQNPD